jgi:hypothetical protein
MYAFALPSFVKRFCCFILFTNLKLNVVGASLLQQRYQNADIVWQERSILYPVAANTSFDRIKLK